MIIIVGPTAVGKTDLCVKLAQWLGCDIISCDSRQFYRELNIGTAKPRPEEMQDVKHHFIDSHSVEVLYSAGDFEREVEVFLKSYFLQKNVVIMTGGSGLFVDAVVNGLDDMPEAPIQLRAELMQRLENGEKEKMQSELKELDPSAYESIDIQNSQRLVRALEVCLSTGGLFSSFQKKTEKEHFYKIIKIGIERPREELYQRINTRVDLMLQQGLLDEVKDLEAFKDKNALKTVGYKEVFGHLSGETDYQTMVDLIKRNTRRYAKRQLTWFKNKDTFEWFDAQAFEDIKSFVANQMA
ncbi:tRNA (adenosine(37)-N6)-dimethylallyltransferase MiaA [Lacihabitans sp. CCS-44]|uniref:tRNA (adenosine(37)-N6)-dimethylallyltransferase MiaA n=1 Tax=Lacihabitans sp. CCS-44 TaxID=2487331 RepID=UPI0020CF13F4|nr:tRNA (adenosine(37)-N6)-dimethylallyltransferase MiaA [Lacihabitans sp. CCS-44]